MAARVGLVGLPLTMTSKLVKRDLRSVLLRFIEKYIIFKQRYAILHIKHQFVASLIFLN